MTAPATSQTCHECDGIFAADDMLGGICLICRFLQRICVYCGTQQHERHMIHMPAQKAGRLHAATRPDRWICGKCFVAKR